jgi:ATP-binding cassette subfamily B protein
MSMRGGGGGRSRVSGSDYAAQRAANAEAPKIPDLLPLVVVLALQRYFVRGLLAGSTKG